MNTLSIFSGGQIWLETAFWPTLAFAVLIITVHVGLLGCQRYFPDNTLTTQPVMEHYELDFKVKHLTRGVLGGLAGVGLSAFLMGIATWAMHDFASPILLVCGAFGGLGFGLLTKGNRKIRGLVTCLFGVAAILVAMFAAYITPVGTQQVQNLATGATNVVNIYLGDEYSLAGFLSIQLSNINMLFFSTLGLIAAYLGNRDYP
ncbi:MAG: hypothetical protein ACQCN6_05240 [Candidatus Bathyarchaeia archaeon]